MKKNGKNKIVLLALVLVLALSLTVTACAVTSQMENSPVESAVSQSVNVSRSFYRVGDLVTLGEKQASVGGAQITLAPTYVVYPNGAAHIYSGAFTVSEAGEYTVRFSGNADGKTVTAEETFCVCDKLYNVGASSSATFGTIPTAYYESHLAENDANESLKNREGLIVRLAAGDTFRYNRVLDLSQSSTALPVLRMYCLPERQESYSDGVTQKMQNLPDAARIRIRLTDAHDEGNYAEMYLTACSAASECDHLSAVQVGFNGNLSHRTHWAPGALTDFNVASRNNRIFSLTFDSEQLLLSCKPAVRIDGPLPALSDADTFSEPWQGFTTGECYLTIEGIGIEANALNLMIFDIMGVRLDSEIDSGEVAPAISVDTLGYDADRLPNAKVGEPYPLFASSVRGGSAAKVEVYYDYDGATPSRVQVKDNAFVPQRVGKYSIVYTAKNTVGTTAEKVLHVTADDGATLSFALDGQKLGGVAGRKLQLFDAITVCDARGKESVEITVTNFTTGKDMAVVENAILPLDAGEYTVTVTCRDYCIEKSITYTVTVSASDAPQIYGDARLPKYLIANATYTVPELYGYAFSSGRAKTVTASVSAYEDGSATAKSVAGEYTVKAESSVRFVYTVTDTASGKTASKAYTVPVVDVGYGDILDGGKYFVSAEGIVYATGAESGVQLTVGARVNGCAESEFINAVQVKNFALTLRTLENISNAAIMRVRLIDTTDETNGIDIAFYDGGSATYIRVNESEQEYTCPVNIMRTSGQILIAYNADSKMLTLTDGASRNAVALRVAQGLDGKPFGGFSENAAYLSVRFEGMTGAQDALPRVCVESINNQMFGGLEEDLTQPQVLSDDQSGAHRMGSTVTLTRAQAFDVLDPNVHIVLYVTDPNNNAVTAMDGTVLNGVAPDKEYTFILSEAGDYRVRYAISDNWLSSNYSYTVQSEHNVLPTLTVTGGDKTGETGKTVKLGTVSASDGATVQAWMLCPRSTGYVSLTDANGKMFTGFVPQTAGVYEVVFAVCDESGNYVTQSYTVTVR